MYVDQSNWPEYKHADQSSNIDTSCLHIYIVISDYVIHRLYSYDWDTESDTEVNLSNTRG